MVPGCSSCVSDTDTSRPSRETKEQIADKVINEVKSWGVKEAYIDNDDFFVYGVESGDLGAPAYQVAEAFFPLVEEIPDVKGVKVIDISNKKELGRYTKY